MQYAKQTFTDNYIPKVQHRLNVFCSRYGIRNDRVSFLNVRNVKIKAGRMPPTQQSARALLGFIPFGFRLQEGLHNTDFDFKFEDGFCLISFYKNIVRIPKRQKRLEAYLAKYNETTTAEFITENKAKLPYGRMGQTTYCRGVLLRRIPYKFRMLEKLCSTKAEFEFKTDGFCYITFKR